MSAGARVAFLWHLHQPDYRDPVGVGDMALPWVRLHATRSYTDLARVLEEQPTVRATVNISPTLIEQLEDLVHKRCGDRFLDLSLRPADDLSLHDRMEILRGFFIVDWERSVRPMERYWQLLHKRGRDLRSVNLERVATEFTVDELRDLQVLFNLAWMGFTARETEDVVKNLLRKGERFTEVEKEVLLDCQERLVAAVLPRWRELAESGRVELSTSPRFHPILPLLIDTESASRAIPEADLPSRVRRPEDARIQLSQALDLHRRQFGRSAAGVWPPEGSVSPESCALLAAHGVRWCASDEGVLLVSEAEDGEPIRRRDLYRPWSLPTDEGEIAVVFRDRQLSDLVGFTYAHNPAPQAITDLLSRVLRVAESFADDAPDCVVPIIVDGENPWDHYPDSGREFLRGLHEALAESAAAGAGVRTVTFSEAVEEPGPRRLATIHSGSWIESSFRIWCGHPETNAAWEAIGEAAKVLDARGPQMAPENREEAHQFLLRAQGSDWLWWLGDDFVTDTPDIFDGLFRANLAKVYELTGEPTPAVLRRPLSAAAAGAVRRQPVVPPTNMITPIIDGEAPPFIDWYGAGRYIPMSATGNMYQGTHLIEMLHYGVDHTELFLRLDPTTAARQRTDWGRLELHVVTDDRECVVGFPLRRGEAATGQALAGCDGDAPLGQLCFGGIVEVSVPFERLCLTPGVKLLLSVHLLEEAMEIERLPRYGYLTIRVPASNEGRRGLKA